LQGSMKVVNYLMTLGFQNLLKQPIMCNIFHFCVFDTQKLQKNEVIERKNIIDLLVKADSSFISDVDLFGQTPLLLPNIHIDLLMHLISFGMQEICTTVSLKEILHITSSYLTPEEYDQLVKCLVKRKKFQIYHCEAFSIPLYDAVENLELLESTLDVFKITGINFNDVDSVYESVLYYAVKGHRSSRVLKYLIDQGLSVHIHNTEGQTVLHKAASVGNLTAVRYLTSVGIDVNFTDKGGNTALHEILLSQNSPSIKHSIVDGLIKNGAHVNIVSGYTGTPLAVALRQKENGRGEECTFELLKDAGAQ